MRSLQNQKQRRIRAMTVMMTQLRTKIRKKLANLELLLVPKRLWPMVRMKRLDSKLPKNKTPRKSIYLS